MLSCNDGIGNQTVFNVLQEVSYSHLILCTGSDGPFPGKCNIVDSYQKAIVKYEDIVKEVVLSTVILILSLFRSLL